VILEASNPRVGTATRAVRYRKSALSESVDALNAQRQKLRRGMEHMIDSLADGVIDRDQFTSRMNRTKSRIAAIETKLAAHAAAEERRIQVGSAMSRLAELSTHLQTQLNDADWTTKREALRAFTQRIEIGPRSVAVVLRVPAETSGRTLESITVLSSRSAQQPQIRSAHRQHRPQSLRMRSAKVDGASYRKAENWTTNYWQRRSPARC